MRQKQSKRATRLWEAQLRGAPEESGNRAYPRDCAGKRKEGWQTAKEGEKPSERLQTW